MLGALRLFADRPDGIQWFAMTSRFPVFAIVIALLGAAVVITAQTPAAPAQNPAASSQTKKPWTAPKLADGHPDLQGVWTNATITQLQRPAGLTKLNLTDAEAKAFEEKDADAAAEKPGKDGVTLGGATFSGAN